MLTTPLTILKFTSLKATIFILLIFLLKSNLLRLKGGLIGGLVALSLISGLAVTSSIAIGSLFYIYKIKNKNFSNGEIQSDQDLQTVDV
tara:strand:- start:806 stop:1072 length:267 start_codon:yes stop_codon:yes gene_type:complete